MAFFSQLLRRDLGALAGWSASLAAFALAATGLFHVLSSGAAAQLQGMLARLPAGMARFIAGSAGIFSISGWTTVTVLSGAVQMAIAIWAALAAVEVVTADRDGGTLEFLLALPVRRETLLAGRCLALLVGLGVLHAVVWAAAVGGVWIIGQHIDAGRLAGALALLLLAQAALAGMMVLFSLAFRDQTRAQLATVTAALVFVFLPAIVAPGSAAAPLRSLSPFAHGSPQAYVLTGAGYPWSDAALLAAWALAALLGAIVWFSRQEV